MFRWFVTVYFIVICCWLPANDFDDIAIGILKPFKPDAVQIIVECGEYQVIAHGAQKLSLQQGDRISFATAGKLVKVIRSGETIGRYSRVELKGVAYGSVFRIFLLRPEKEERVYDDNLIVSVDGPELKLINDVALEKYVAGVVEAETGKENTLEFYKAQAVISRTYALNNRERFLGDGYNLNDQVDCQVYHGKCRWEPAILEAVEATRGEVLVDSEMRLITAAFHSNSGGQTVSSGVVWSAPLPYLSPRRDEFSLQGKHANWSETLSRQAWLSYLKMEYDLAINDKLVATMAQNYEQLNRHVYFLDPIFNIPLTEIRSQWGLKSTYFDIEPLGRDSLLFIGRGFGHGTGLSQEGAMRMGVLGFSYTDILHFYYNDVHLIDLKALDFFRKE